jgi:hypothetical protein
MGTRREAIEWIEYRRIHYIAASWFDGFTHTHVNWLQHFFLVSVVHGWTRHEQTLIVGIW